MSAPSLVRLDLTEAVLDAARQVAATRCPGVRYHLDSETMLADEAHADALALLRDRLDALDSAHLIGGAA